MEKLSPTPGRWRVVSPGPTIQNRHDACIEVVTDDYQKAICHVYERRRGQKMPAIPNAWLIAAAPMMFEACEAALIEMIAMGNRANWEEQTQEYVDATNGLRAAIAAAKGEE